MQKNVKEMVAWESLSGKYILSGLNKRTAKNGKDYLDLSLQDRTGTISGKMWEMPLCGLDKLEVGQIVNANFVVSTYNDALQLDVKGLYPVDMTSISQKELNLLVPCTEEKPTELFDKLIAIINGLQNETYKAIALEALETVRDAFTRCPGAKSAHHAEIGGLVQHSLEVVKFVNAIYDVDPWFDKELCIVAASVHDIGKLREFTLGLLGLVADYSPKGQLLGHIYIGTEYIGSVAKKHGLDDERVMLLQHIILAHHGIPEFGSAITPKTMEAEVVHMADNLSAKLRIFKDAVKDTEPGTCSDRIFALNGDKVYKPKYQK